MTLAEVLSQIQYALVETVDGGVTVSSGLWTVAELRDAVDNAQQWVVAEATPIFYRATLVTVPNETRYPLPQDWIATRRVVWASADGRTKVDLSRDSSWSADYLTPFWPTHMQQRPQIYSDVDGVMPELQVMPAAIDNGVLEVTYVPVTPIPSSTWTIPDMLIPMAKWKAIAYLLAKDGRGQDLPRAAVADALAMQGMAALKIFLKGWA